VNSYKLSARAARAYDRRAVWTGPQVEKKEIIGSGALGVWASGGVSRQDGNNFRTNMVTLAQYSDAMAGSNATGLAATWACVRLISGTAGSLPCAVYRSENGIQSEAREHPLYRVLRESPNFDQTPVDFFRFVFASIELQGNAYAAIERRNDGSVYSLTPIRPDLVTVRRKGNGFLEYEWTEDGRRQVRDVADVLHIRGPMGSALGGVSALSACRGVFSSAMSAEQAARETFANGMRPSGVLATKPDETLTGEQRDKLETILQERFVGSMNAGRPMLLDRGLTWQAINITPEDAQMLDSRKFSGEEICRIFGVPPAMVGYGDKSSNWGTGKEVDVLGFIKFNLRDRLKSVEQSLQKQLLLPADRAAGLTVSFNMEALLRGDTEARFNSYEKGIRMGIYTRNEVRGFENLPPVPGGDVVTVQMQDVPLAGAARGQEGSNGPS
jgi:HK97 family phage portal protein